MIYFLGFTKIIEAANSHGLQYDAKCYIDFRRFGRASRADD